jgi:hypothetical protein
MMDTQWKDLPIEEQERIREGSRALAELAWKYTCGIIINEPTRPIRCANTASGFVIVIATVPYLATASHVLRKFVTRRSKHSSTIFQVGNLALDPEPRIVYDHHNRDLVLVSLAGLDITKTGSTPYHAPSPWPPAQPQPGEYIQFCGFPKAFRRYEGEMEVAFEALPGFAGVKSVGEHHCMCQLEREELINFGWGEIPPAKGFRAMSGGPVLLFGVLSYPIIGLISEFLEPYEILRLSTFVGVPEKLERATT